MRSDDRRNDELRPVTIVPGYVIYPEGSVLYSAGKTKVLCNVTIEEGVPRWMQTQGVSGGWITAEYSLLPRSTHQRTPRDSNTTGGRSHEIRRLIGRSLRAAIDLSKLGQRTCIVDCDVIQADGGTRTAAITGGYVALVIALNKLIQAGILPPETIKTAIAAVSVGVVRGIPMLDLCYEEDSLAEVDMNVVMTAQGDYVEVQSTAEGVPFSRDTLNTLLDLAYKGISELLAIQRTVLQGLPL